MIWQQRQGIHPLLSFFGCSSSARGSRIANTSSTTLDLDWSAYKRILLRNRSSRFSRPTGLQIIPFPYADPPYTKTTSRSHNTRNNSKSCLQVKVLRAFHYLPSHFSKASLHTLPPLPPHYPFPPQTNRPILIPKRRNRKSCPQHPSSSSSAPAPTSGNPSPAPSVKRDTKSRSLHGEAQPNLPTTAARTS